MEVCGKQDLFVGADWKPHPTPKQLVGLTYQCIPNPHVQSMLLATDHIGMKILLDPDLAYSVPLDTPPWGGPELPVGYSICYADYGKAVSKTLSALWCGPTNQK